MVRCCQPRLGPNPTVPRLDLRKVRVHVQRPRGGGGSSSRGPGDQPPRLEGPGLGTLSRRARFRYWGWRWGACSLVSVLPRCPAQGSASLKLVPLLLQRAGRVGGALGESDDVSGFTWVLPAYPTFLKLCGGGGEQREREGTQGPDEQCRRCTFPCHH